MAVTAPKYRKRHQSLRDVPPENELYFMPHGARQVTCWISRSEVIDTVDGPMRAADWCHWQVRRLQDIGWSAAVIRSATNGYVCVVRLDAEHDSVTS